MYKGLDNKFYNHNYGPFANNNDNQPDMCGFEVWYLRIVVFIFNYLFLL